MCLKQCSTQNEHIEFLSSNLPQALPHNNECGHEVNISLINRGERVKKLEMTEVRISPRAKVSRKRKGPLENVNVETTSSFTKTVLDEALNLADNLLSLSNTSRYVDCCPIVVPIGADAVFDMVCKW